jgi:type II secretory pathway component PulF
MKKFFYIALKKGKTCDGIIRAESIDLARSKLMRQGLEEINLVILQSDKVEFLDYDDHKEECANP